MGMAARSNRLKLIVLAVVLISISMPLHAQERYLSRKISVSVSSVPMEEALQTIGEAGHFTFSYNAELIDPSQKVTMNVTDRNVDAVLTDLLGEKVRRKEVGDHIVLVMNVPRREKPEAKTESTVSGVVTEAGTGRLLADATVYDIGGKRSALTGNNGRYTITFNTGEAVQTITYCKVGYRDTVVFIRPLGNRNLNIALKPRAPVVARIASQSGAVEIASVNQSGLTIDSLPFVNALVSRRIRINSLNLRIFDTWPVQFSLVPYLSTNWKVSGSVNSAFSLNLLVGYTGGVRGLELGGLLNIDRNHVRGAQFGGLGNIVGKKTSGLQTGGLFNINLGHLYGCQLAGLFNWLGDTLRGAQIAGLFNYVPTRWKGAQISGLANVSLDHVTGFQLAGLLNFAQEENRGVQVAGLLNYAKSLKGVQVGLFNVTGRVESGVPVGFFSYVHKGGYIRAEVSADEVFYGNVAFKTGTRRLYNIFKVGVGDSLLMNFAYGVGTLFRFGNRLGLSIDLTGSMFFSSQHSFAWYGSQIKLAPALEVTLAKHFALFLGPAFNFCFYSPAGDKAYPDGLPFYNFYDAYHGSTREQMWVGGVIGFRI